MNFNKLLRLSYPTDESAVGADLSCPPPHCISHKRRIAETWRNAFQVPIYRPKGGSKILGLICSGKVQMKMTFPHHRKVLPCHPERSEGSLLHLTPVSHHENNPPSCHRFPRFDSLTSSVILRSAQDLCSEGSDCVALHLFMLIIGSVYDTPVICPPGSQQPLRGPAEYPNSFLKVHKNLYL